MYLQRSQCEKALLTGGTLVLAPHDPPFNRMRLCWIPLALLALAPFLAVRLGGRHGFAP
jgi:hypothetical protein